MKYRIRWDFKEETDGEKIVVSFFETDVHAKYKLRFFDIKNAILDAINKDTDYKIISGFQWRNMPVWLSTENQFNYKAAYDLAVISQGKSLPVVFKFGTTENPIYYTFDSLEEISDFYLSAMAYINNTLEEGWKAKDSINWDIYKTIIVNN